MVPSTETLNTRFQALWGPDSKLPNFVRFLRTRLKGLGPWARIETKEGIEAITYMGYIIFELSNLNESTQIFEIPKSTSIGPWLILTSIQGWVEEWEMQI